MYVCIYIYIQEQKKVIRNMKMEWDLNEVYEQSILELMAKLKNIDKSMLESGIVRKIIDKSPIEVQRNLAAIDYNNMEDLLAYVRRMDELKLKGEGRYISPRKQAKERR